MSERGLLIERPEGPRAGAGSAPVGLPRLLSGIPEHGTMHLDEHLALHGQPERERERRRRGQESPLISEVERAGLRGHGGAGFPTAVKLRTVASARGRPIVVVNAGEAEPASRKDQTLLQMLPHLVLDGAQLAAQAVGARELILAICESAPASVDSVERALSERRELAGERARTQLAVIPNRYVASQETALLQFLGGGPALPTFTPPLPAEQGFKRRPTLVSNAETLAHLALIARHGADWFRELGTPSQPGSALVTLSGPVAHPGVYEIEHGASLSSLLEAAGGTTSAPQALLVGGYGGAWIGGELLRGVGLSDEHLAAHDASLGAGVLALLSNDACPVAETARLARWMASQNARQCGPCVHGLDAIAGTLAQIASGTAGAEGTQRAAQLGALVRRRGACHHPDGVARLVSSALETFAAEFAEHARHGVCAGCHRAPELPFPGSST